MDIITLALAKRYAQSLALGGAIPIPGPPGLPGRDGADGMDGSDGREIELRASAGQIEWRYAGEDAWVKLLPLSALKGLDGNDGADGADGETPEFQVVSNVLQYRFPSDLCWTDLFVFPEEAKTGGSGTYDHAELQNLSFAESGHTGFAPKQHSHAEYLKAETDPVFTAMLPNLAKAEDLAAETARLGKMIAALGNVLTVEVLPKLPSPQNMQENVLYLVGVGTPLAIWKLVGGEPVSLGVADIDLTRFLKTEDFDAAVKILQDRITVLEKGATDGGGRSAFEIAAEQGFDGTVDEWLKSLEGTNGLDGRDGADGKSAFEIAAANGFVGTQQEWLNSLPGAVRGIFHLKVEDGHLWFIADDGVNNPGL